MSNIVSITKQVDDRIEAEYKQVSDKWHALEAEVYSLEYEIYKITKQMHIVKRNLDKLEEQKNNINK